MMQTGSATEKGSEEKRGRGQDDASTTTRKDDDQKWLRLSPADKSMTYNSVHNRLLIDAMRKENDELDELNWRVQRFEGDRASSDFLTLLWEFSNIASVFFRTSINI